MEADGTTPSSDFPYPNDMRIDDLLAEFESKRLLEGTAVLQKPIPAEVLEPITAADVASIGEDAEVGYDLALDFMCGFEQGLGDIMDIGYARNDLTIEGPCRGSWIQFVEHDNYVNDPSNVGRVDPDYED